MKTKQIILLIAILIAGIFIGKFVFNNGPENELHKATTEKKHWTCSMHPQIDMPEFGDCPICGMDLILKEDTSSSDEVSSFKMSKNAIALSNIETIVVGKTKSTETDKNTLKLSGKIMANDNTTSIQAAHFGGRIEKLYFKSIGDFVKKGALVASIYSPELVTAQNELIEALNIKEIQPQLYKAVRNKLVLWKISEKQIQTIERTKKVVTNFNIYANVSGNIEQFFAEEGNHIKEGSPLFKASNFSSVWAAFDVYEQDIKHLKKGQKIKIQLNAYPTEKITAKINFINPNLNTKTRTVTVRATLSNKKNILKPGMIIAGIVAVKNNINATLSAITIPKTAVLWTGKRSVVYIKTDENDAIFELREIQIGSTIGKNYQVLSGLSSGEEIVTNGTFTVDATAQLLGKNSMMNHTKKGEKEIIEDKKPILNKIVVNSVFKEQIHTVFQGYIRLKNDFVLTDATKASNTSKMMSKSLQKVQMKLLKNKEAHSIWMKEKQQIKAALETIQQETDVAKQRTAFINLSTSMIVLVTAFGVQETTYVQFCPMANNNKGANWLSLEEGIKNPYYGDKMLRCGSITQTIDK